MPTKQAINDKLQGSVATYITYGGIFNIHLTANLPRNLAVEKISDGYDMTELWSRVCGPAFWSTLYVLIP